MLGNIMNKARVYRQKALSSLVVVVVSTLIAGGFEVSASIDPLQAAAGRVDQSVLKATVKVISSPKQAGQSVTGTGFLVSQEVKQGTSQSRFVYLVTNKHVVSDWDPSGHLIASKVAVHPNPSIDVAIVRLDQA